jgi:branched-chain amino acid transport system substrate-binding protein
MVRALFTSFILGLVFVMSCGSPVPARGMVKIGLAAPLAGRDYATGYDVLFAVKLAIQQWNAKGGVGGYRIELVAYDDRNEAEAGATQARKMVIDTDVLGVIGHLSNPSALAAAPEYHKGEMAAIFLGATTDELTQKAYPEVFQLGAGDALIAQEAARFAAHTLRCGSVAVLSESSPSAMNLAQAFEGAAAKMGMIVAHSELLQTGRTEYGELIKRLRAASPDLIFYSGSFVQGASLLAETSKVGKQMLFLGGPLCASPDFIKIGGQMAEGAYYISLAPDPRQLEDAEEFRASYRALSGTEAWASAIYAYDATNLLLTAVERAIGEGGKPDRAAVVRALASMESYEGLTGEIAFDNKGARVAAKVYIYRIAKLCYPGQLEYVGGQPVAP